jgi:aspartate/methionine/tyrosine aminotransferase
MVAVEALKLGRPWVQPRIDELAVVREHVHDALAQLGELVSFPRTQGAFYVLMKLPGVEDPLAFNRAMAQRHKVATVPGFAFGLTDVRRANYQRLSFGALAPASVEEGVRRFVAAVRDWYEGAGQAR